MTDKHPAAVPETLKPCPFCGGQAVISAGTYADGSAWPYIECLECGASAELDIWNRRAPTDQVHPASDSDRGDTGDPVVGHKTLTNGTHVPLRKSEADAILARVELAEAQRRAAMPDEQSAINTLFNAWQRLKDFGWNDAIYSPKDGSSFSVLECGSTGIHTAHYGGEWPNGSWWIEAAGDLWPSRPVLWKARND